VEIDFERGILGESFLELGWQLQQQLFRQVETSYPSKEASVIGHSGPEVGLEEIT
jgi:hypothetical protein